MPSEPSSVVPSSTRSCAGALQAKAERARKATAYLVNIDVTPMELLQVRSTGDWLGRFLELVWPTPDGAAARFHPKGFRGSRPPFAGPFWQSQFPDAHPL